VTVLGLLGLHVAFAVCGMAILLAAGLVRLTPIDVAVAAGPACLVGLLATLLLGVLALVLGLSVKLPLVLVLALAVALAAAALWWRRRPLGVDGPGARTGVERWLPFAAGALFLLVWVYGARASNHLAVAWDDAHIWTFKGLTIYLFGGLDHDVLLSPLNTASHPDYPVLQPLLEATTFHAIGRADAGLFHVELWLLLGLATWTAGWLLRPYRPLLWLPGVALFAVLPQLRANVAVGYADAVDAALLGLGALAAGVWLERGGGGRLALSALFLAAAANVKNEGTAGAILVVVALAVAVLARRPRALRPLALAAVAVVLAIVPWRLWVSLNHVHGDATVPLRDALDPSFLSGRTNRLSYASREMVRKLGDAGQWADVPAIFLATALYAAVATRARRLALYYLGITVLLFLALLWVYWTSPQELGFNVDTTVDRTVSGAAVVAMLGLTHLCCMLGARLPGRAAAAVGAGRVATEPAAEDVRV
jgi:hypothetical protein